MAKIEEKVGAPTVALEPVEKVAQAIAAAVEHSPADRTEIAWLEVRHRAASHGSKRNERRDRHERSAFVRVREKGRIGCYRAESCERGDLERAVRLALAEARLAPPHSSPQTPSESATTSTTPESAMAAKSETAPTTATTLCDPEIVRLTAESARALLERGLGNEESGRLVWSVGTLVHAATDAPVRQAELTGAQLELHVGRGPSSGRAAAVGRTLAALGPRSLLDAARALRRTERADVDRAKATPLVLAPLAVARLIGLLNRHALSSWGFRGGIEGSWLRERLGERIAAEQFTLRDDGTDPRGLPLPFDLRGRDLRPIELIAHGVFLTPAVDDDLAQEIHRDVTPHAIGPDESRATHLVIAPGETSAADLLRAAEGGLWISDLAPLEGFEPRALRFRGIAHGVRQITHGELGAAVDNFSWDGDLPSVLGSITAIGSDLLAVADGDGDAEPFLGATLAPAIGLAPSLGSS
jgi:PmbA protein